MTEEQLLIAIGLVGSGLALLGLWRAVLSRPAGKRVRLSDGAVAANAKPATADAVLAFMMAMRDLRLGWRLYLYGHARNMSELSLWDYGERCAFSLRLQTQYQHHYTETKRDCAPSKKGFINWYAEAQPRRPQAFAFEARTEHFPLEPSIEFYRCGRCSGSGKVKCGCCSGSGKVDCSCSSCSGSGKRLTEEGKRKSCRACDGKGKWKETCSRCDGSGRVNCDDCEATGELFRYEQEVFAYYHKKAKDIVQPQSIQRTHTTRRIRKAFKDESCSFEIEGFSLKEVQGLLGVYSPAVAEEATRAERRFGAMLGTARDRESGGHSMLFQSEEKLLLPLSYVNTEVGGIYSQFWAAGRRGTAKLVQPRLRVDGRKLLGWGGLMGTLPCAVTMFAEPGMGLVAGCLGWCSGGMFAWSARGLRHSKLDRVVVILGEDDGASRLLLALVVQLIGYYRLGVVLDEFHSQLAAMLLGRKRGAGQSVCCRVALDADPEQVLCLVAPASVEIEHATAGLRAVLAASDAVCRIARPGMPARRDLLEGCDVREIAMPLEPLRDGLWRGDVVPSQAVALLSCFDVELSSDEAAAAEKTESPTGSTE